MSGPGRTPGRRTRATPAPDTNTNETPSFGPGRTLSPTRSPSRNTRQGRSPTKSELPALTARGSRNYGGAGRPSLVEESRNSNRNTNPFDAARNTADAAASLAAATDPSPPQTSSPARPKRGAQHKRESSVIDTEMVPAFNTAPAKRGPGRPRRTLQPIEEDGMTGVTADDEDDEEEEDSRPDELAALSRRRGFSPSRRNLRAPSSDGTTLLADNANNFQEAAQIARGVQERRSRTASPGRQRPLATNNQQQAGPSTVRAFATGVNNMLATLYQYLRDAYHYLRDTLMRHAWKLLLFAGVPSTIAILTWLCSPWLLSTLISLRPVETVKDYGQSAVTSLSTFTNPFHNITWGPVIDLQTAARIKQLENRLDYLNSRNTLSENAIEKLRQILPKYTLVEYKDGKYEVPDIFLRALQEKVNAELGLASTIVASNDQWEEWEKVNGYRVRKAFDTMSHNALSIAIKHKFVHTGEEVIAWIEKAHRSFPERYLNPLREELQEKMDKWSAETRNTTSISTRQEVEKILSDRLSTLPEAQLSVLAQALILQNAHDALKSVNHMAAGLGAIVQPYLTSPTHDIWRGNMTAVRWFHWMLSPFWGEYREPPSAVAALEPWFEAGNCWCASPWEDKPVKGILGQRAPVLQLGVLIARPIYPATITIEHAPAEAVLNIRNAPHTMELWVSINNATIRDEVYSVSRDIFAARGAQEYPPASTNTDGIELDQTYVRIGRWVYDPRLPNHVQTFPLQVRLDDFGVGIQRLAVRALTNWGEDYTCLYRVRLHGEPVEPRKSIVVGGETSEGVYYDEQK